MQGPRVYLLRVWFDTAHASFSRSLVPGWRAFKGREGLPGRYFIRLNQLFRLTD